MSFDIIVALDKKGGFGKGGMLPWFFPKELAHFSRITRQSFYDNDEKNTLIMGRKTWESIPEKKRPLVGRQSIVVSSTMKEDTGECEIARSLQHALDKRCLKSKCFIIGGYGLIKEAMSHPLFDTLWLSRIEGTFDCDLYIKEWIDIENENVPFKTIEDTNQSDKNIYTIHCFQLNL